MGKGRDHGLHLGGWVRWGQQSTAISSWLRCRQFPSPFNACFVVCGEIEMMAERSWALGKDHTQNYQSCLSLWGWSTPWVGSVASLSELSA